MGRVVCRRARVERRRNARNVCVKRVACRACVRRVSCVRADVRVGGADVRRKVRRIRSSGRLVFDFCSSLGHDWSMSPSVPPKKEKKRSFSRSGRDIPTRTVGISRRRARAKIARAVLSRCHVMRGG